MSEGEWAGIRPVVPWFSSSFPSEQLISSSTSTATGATHIPRGSDEFQRTWCVHGTGSPLSLFGGFDFRGCMLEPPAASRESTQSETVFSLLNPGLSRPSNIFFSLFFPRCGGAQVLLGRLDTHWHSGTTPRAFHASKGICTRKISAQPSAADRVGKPGKAKNGLLFIIVRYLSNDEHCNRHTALNSRLRTQGTDKLKAGDSQVTGVHRVDVQMPFG